MSTWMGGQDNNNFNDPKNWSPNGVPNGVNATISAGSTIVLTQNELISGSGGATLTGLGDITISGPYNLQIDSDLYVTAGETLVLSGSDIQISTGLEIAGHGTFEIDGGRVSISQSLSIGSSQDLYLKDTDFSTNSTIVGSGTIILDGSTLDVENDYPLPAVDFVGTHNTLDIPYYSNHEGPIENFGFGDTIHTAPGDKLSLVANNSAGGYELLDDVGQYTDTISTDVSLAKGLTPADFVNVDGNFYAICFMAGTAIATPYGEVPVESLQIGDPLTLSDGRVMPMAWLGKQTVSTRFADPMRVLPIRIKADALGDSLPRRDLLVSPEHALLVGDILIQAGALVNGVSILRETGVPERFTYYHVELADHSLILAESVPAETFVDHVDRKTFDNWAEYEALYGSPRDIVEMPHPRAKSHRQVPPAIRRWLMDRAVAIYGKDIAAAS